VFTRASFRNGQQAIAYAKAACNLTSWNKPDQIDTLAAAYAETRDFDSTIQFEQQALTHEREEGNRKEYQYRLGMYQANIRSDLPGDNKIAPRRLMDPSVGGAQSLPPVHFLGLIAWCYSFY
jgi:hypothetical protein